MENYQNNNQDLYNSPVPQQKSKKIWLLLLIPIFVIVIGVLIFLFVNISEPICTENWNCGEWSSCSEQ